MSKENIELQINEAEKLSAEYKKGYAEAIEEIRKSLAGGGGGGGPQGPPQPLPDPRLKRPKPNPNQQQNNNQQGGQQGGQQGNQQGGGQQGSQQGGKQDKKQNGNQNQDKQQTGGNGGNGNKKDPSKMNKDEAAEAAKEAAENAQKSADAAKKAAENAKKDAAKSGDDGDIEAAKKAEEAAKKAQDAADKAKTAAGKAQDAADKGDTEGAQEAAKEAQDAANEAAKNENQSQNGGNANDENQEGEGDPNGWSEGEMSDDAKKSDPKEYAGGKLWDCSQYAGKVKKIYKDKVVGAIGDYNEICSNAKDEIRKLADKKSGKGAVKTYTKRAKASWDVELKALINAHITNCVQEKKNEYKRTFMRHNRRQGVVSYGEPILKGRLPKRDKLDITMTYYIDKSGSMGTGKLENAMRASWLFSKSIVDNNKNETVVGDFDFTYYTFNTEFYKLKPNEMPTSSGSNVNFDEILEYIHAHSLNDMVNIIITDAEFPIRPQQCIKAIKQTEGLFIVVANNNKNMSDFEDIEKALPGKFKFLLADEDFTFKIK